MRVRVTGADGEISAWSAPAVVEAGLLHPADWTAQMITSAADPAPLVRKEFRLDGPVVSARLYITAHGLYRASINGQPVSDDAFAPGWTTYHRRLRYQAYDVADLLRPGANAIGFTVADGWWRGRLGFVPGRRDTYGTSLGLLAQLEVTLTELEVALRLPLANTTRLLRPRARCRQQDREKRRRASPVHQCQYARCCTPDNRGKT